MKTDIKTRNDNNRHTGKECTHSLCRRHRHKDKESRGSRENEDRHKDKECTTTDIKVRNAHSVCADNTDRHRYRLHRESTPDSKVLEEAVLRRKVSGDGTMMASSEDTSAQYSTCCLLSYRLPPVPVM